MIRNTLAALTLLVGTIQPAQANDDFAKILFGVIVGAAIVDASRNNSTIQHTVPTHNYTVERCGYIGQAFYQGRWVVSEKRNRCTGELVERTVRPR